MSKNLGKNEPDRPLRKHPSSKKLALGILCGLLATAGAAILGLYWATQYVPEFYRKAMEVDPAAQRQAAQRMDRQVLDLASRMHTSGHWRTAWTVEQVNAWLAVLLPKKLPGLLPSELVDPRVAIERGGITLACRYCGRYGQTVLTLAVEPYVPEPGVLALRIRKARAGLAPLPLGKILARLADAVRAADFHASWHQSGGDPVLQIAVPAGRPSRQPTARIEGLELRNGEIRLEGTTAAAK